MRSQTRIPVELRAPARPGRREANVCTPRVVAEPEDRRVPVRFRPRLPEPDLRAERRAGWAASLEGTPAQ